MGFMCVKGRGECIGCMDCKPETHYSCPMCGKEVYEEVFVDKKSKEIIGCENCIVTQEPPEVM